MPDATIDTANKWLIGLRIDGSLVLRRPAVQLSRDDALLLAAWLVVMVNAQPGEFERVREAVEHC